MRSVRPHVKKGQCHLVDCKQDKRAGLTVDTLPNCVMNKPNNSCFLQEVCWPLALGRHAQPSELGDELEVMEGAHRKAEEAKLGVVWARKFGAVAM